MASGMPHTQDQSHNSTLRAVLWVGLAFLACLSVLLINGRPLFYFDSPAYLEQGSKILEKLGLFSQASQGAGGGVQDAGDHTVNGSRSAVFSLIFSLITRLGTVTLMTIGNAVLIVGSASLTMGVLGRLYAPQKSVAFLVAVPLVVATAGSLPFYVAYLMPDILTGILLLMIATLTVYVRQMHKWEILLALAFGCLAVVSHISHIAIAAAMVPVAAIGGLAIARPRWWVAPVLVAVMVLVGLGERSAFRVAAKSVASSEVVYIPFLTARLIQDGPGLEFLENNCPSDELQSCALFRALSQSSDPMRLTASHIIFETNPELGSFKFLTNQEQAGVAREQFSFFFQVLRASPFSTTGAIIKNTLTQATMNSVKMTIPGKTIMTNTHRDYAGAQKSFDHGRLTFARGWLNVVNPVHTAVYVLSLAVVIFGLVMPGRLPGPLKIFAILCVLGILANAFVCGAASQPADRYGARVIWILPFLASVLTLFMTRVSRRGA